MAQEIHYQLLIIYINYLKYPFCRYISELRVHFLGSAPCAGPAPHIDASIVNKKYIIEKIAMTIVLHFSIINPYEGISDSIIQNDPHTFLDQY